MVIHKNLQSIKQMDIQAVESNL